MTIDLEPDDSPEAVSLVKEIVESRECGVAKCWVSLVVGGEVPLGDLAVVRAVAARLLETADYGPPGGGPPITREQGQGLVAAILATDLAYRSPMLTSEAAEGLAARFFRRFSADAVFLTNGTLGLAHARGSGSGGWVPVSGATFDTGVVAVDRRRVGLVWVEDED